MRVCLIAGAFLTYVALVTSAVAQESQAEIIPERLQQLAMEVGAAESLGIKWEAATHEDIGKYM